MRLVLRCRECRRGWNEVPCSTSSPFPQLSPALQMQFKAAWLRLCPNPLSSLHQVYVNLESPRCKRACRVWLGLGGSLKAEPGGCAGRQVQSQAGSEPQSHSLAGWGERVNGSPRAGPPSREIPLKALTASPPLLEPVRLCPRASSPPHRGRGRPRSPCAQSTSLDSGRPLSCFGSVSFSLVQPQPSWAAGLDRVLMGSGSLGSQPCQAGGRGLLLGMGHLLKLPSSSSAGMLPGSHKIPYLRLWLWMWPGQLQASNLGAFRFLTSFFLPPTCS